MLQIWKKVDDVITTHCNVRFCKFSLFFGKTVELFFRHKIFPHTLRVRKFFRVLSEHVEDFPTYSKSTQEKLLLILRVHGKFFCVLSEYTETAENPVIFSKGSGPSHGLNWISNILNVHGYTLLVREYYFHEEKIGVIGELMRKHTSLLISSRTPKNFFRDGVDL